MGAVRYLARAQIRRRWGTLLLVTLLIGLVGGVAIALVSGARRSSTVVDRYFDAANPYSLQMYSPGITQAQASALPGVERADGFSYIPFVVQPDGDIRGGPVNANAAPAAMLDDTFKLLAGRYPRPGALDEAIVNQPYVEAFGVKVGDTVNMRAFANDDAAGGNSTSGKPTGPTHAFHVVGIMRTPGEVNLHEARLVGSSVYERDEAIWLSIEFFDAHRNDIYDFGKGYLLILGDPAQRPAVEVAARKLNAAAGNVDLLSFSDPPYAQSRPSYETPVTLESAALLGLGAAIGLIGAIVIVFILRAEQRVHNRERATLHAIGTTQTQLGWAAAVRVLPAAIAGAGAAWLLAFALSDRFPIGFGGQLELADGRQLNLAVFAVGGVLTVAIVTVCAFGFAFRSPRAPSARRGAVTSWFDRVGAPRDAVLGAHFAFGHGDQQATVPTRPALVGGILAVVVIVAAGIFVNSVDDLYATPSHRGWTWDVAVGNPDVPFSDPQTVEKLRTDPRFAESTFASFGPVTIDGRAVDVLAIDTKGTAPPEVLDGRLPRTANEIVLGPKLRDLLGRDIGDVVNLLIEAGGDGAPTPSTAEPVAVTVVGIGVSPAFSNAEIGQQAIVATEAIEASGPQLPAMLLARVKGDPESTIADLARTYPDQMTIDIIASRAVSLHEVRSLPLLALGLAAALAIVLLTYTLMAGTSARRRELGVLRALGVSARRLGRVLTWQGIVIALVLTVVGVPIGLLAGNAAWQRVADDIGLPIETTFAWWIAIVPIGIVAVGILCSLLPSRRARRANVAALLRAE